MEKNPKLLKWNVKEWFIIIGTQQEGPYSLLDLKKDYRFTPDILVWRKGFQEWIPARFVAEIKEIFKDEPDPVASHEEENKGGEAQLGQQNQATLTLQQDPYQLFLWILILLLILFYTFYKLNDRFFSN